MTTHGCIESRISAGMGVNAGNEAFVTIYNFFNNLSSIGVTRIAYNKGNGGTGMTYWDQGTPPGNNAWALFRFGNAAIPFYVLIQGANCTSTTGASYSGYAGCTPCVASSSNGNISGGSYGCVAIAVAMRLDGSSPWGGTTVNTGTDTKGSPVWTPGASTLAVFPRTNSLYGNRSTNRDACTPIITSGFGSSFADVSMGLKINILVDENNILFACDGGCDGSYSMFFFGKYTPKTGITAQIPYVMLNNMMPTSPPFLNVGNNQNYYYGPIDYALPGYGASTGDGGIIHPIASVGTKIVSTDWCGTMPLTQYNPSKASPFLGRWDLMPVHVVMFEAPYQGLLGTINFFKYVQNVETHMLTPDLRNVVLGSGIVNDMKLLVPWDGVTVPGTGISRTGVIF
jgi:hypothetical protein